MRALHLFPTYASEAASGSDAHQRGLTRALARGGVEIEVLTTCTRRPLAHATFGLGWPMNEVRGRADLDGISVRRFPVSFSPGRILSRAVSLPIVARWRHEESRAGRFPTGSPEALASYHRRALSRPRAYDALALAGRGPHSLKLAGAALESARRADVILAGFTPFATLWYATRVAARTYRPLVLLPFFHPEDPYHHFRTHYRSFARADAVLAETAHGAALLERLAPGCRAVEIGVGVDSDELADGRVDGARFRQKYGLGDGRIALFVGRKEAHKRYDLAVEAVERIGDSRLRLVMIGEDVDRRPIAGARTIALGILGRNDVLDAFDACDVFVLPSEHESFGTVFLEAWMRRKPVIGNAHCGPVASLIEAGRDGLLARDANEMASSIAALLDDPDRARGMGEAGRDKVLARYTWPHLAARVRALYEELAGRRAPRVLEGRGDSW